MTVNEIYTQALLELDESLEDLHEYEQKFNHYLNIGYQIALRDYYKPRELMVEHTDENGIVYLPGYVDRVVAVYRKEEKIPLPFEMCPGDCFMLKTTVHGEHVKLLCEVKSGPLVKLDDVPKLPGHVHHGLVDYICYRQLSSGNLAKQSRAQIYRQNFYEAMRQCRPQMSSPVKYVNFYEATNL